MSSTGSQDEAGTSARSTPSSTTGPQTNVGSVLISPEDYKKQLADEMATEKLRQEHKRLSDLHSQTQEELATKTQALLDVENYKKKQSEDKIKKTKAKATRRKNALAKENKAILALIKIPIKGKPKEKETEWLARKARNDLHVSHGGHDHTEELLKSKPKTLISKEARQAAKSAGAKKKKPNTSKLKTKMETIPPHAGPATALHKLTEDDFINLDPLQDDDHMAILDSHYMHDPETLDGIDPDDPSADDPDHYTRQIYYNDDQPDDDDDDEPMDTQPGDNVTSGETPIKRFWPHPGVPGNYRYNQGTPQVLTQPSLVAKWGKIVPTRVPKMDTLIHFAAEGCELLFPEAKVNATDLKVKVKFNQAGILYFQIQLPEAGVLNASLEKRTIFLLESVEEEVRAVPNFVYEPKTGITSSDFMVYAHILLEKYFIGAQPLDVTKYKTDMVKLYDGLLYQNSLSFPQTMRIAPGVRDIAKATEVPPGPVSRSTYRWPKPKFPVTGEWPIALGWEQLTENSMQFNLISGITTVTTNSVGVPTFPSKKMHKMQPIWDNILYRNALNIMYVAEQNPTYVGLWTASQGTDYPKAVRIVTPRPVTNGEYTFKIQLRAYEITRQQWEQIYGIGAQRLEATKIADFELLGFNEQPVTLKSDEVTEEEQEENREEELPVNVINLTREHIGNYIHLQPLKGIADSHVHEIGSMIHYSDKDTEPIEIEREDSFVSLTD